MKRSMLAVIATALVVVTGCVSSSQAKSVKPSGFLGDSALLLKKAGKDDVLMVYRNKDVEWTSYDKILLDPITIWGAESSTLPPDALADFQRLVDQFHRTLADKLSKLPVDRCPGGWRNANSDRDHQRREGECSVEGRKSSRPYAGYADTLWTFATGKPAFSGEVSLEFMVRDSETGKLLVAGGVSILLRRSLDPLWSSGLTFIRSNRRLRGILN